MRAAFGRPVLFRPTRRGFVVEWTEKNRTVTSPSFGTRERAQEFMADLLEKRPWLAAKIVNEGEDDDL